MPKAFVRHNNRGSEQGEVGDLFLSGTTPHMLICIPTGPDQDHVQYNFLNLETGNVTYIHEFPKIATLFKEVGKYFTPLDGSVTLSKEK
jgi:hypothetical protein